MPLSSSSESGNSKNERLVQERTDLQGIPTAFVFDSAATHIGVIVRLMSCYSKHVTSGMEAGTTQDGKTRNRTQNLVEKQTDLQGAPVAFVIHTAAAHIGVLVRLAHNSRSYRGQLTGSVSHNWMPVHLCGCKDVLCTSCQDRLLCFSHTLSFFSISNGGLAMCGQHQC